jgi:hypothetical protein
VAIALAFQRLVQSGSVNAIREPLGRRRSLVNDPKTPFATAQVSSATGNAHGRPYDARYACATWDRLSAGGGGRRISRAMTAA